MAKIIGSCGHQIKGELVPVIVDGKMKLLCEECRDRLVSGDDTVRGPGIDRDVLLDC